MPDPDPVHRMHDAPSHSAHTRAEHGGHVEHTGHDEHAGHDQHASHDEHAGHDKHAGHSVAMFRDKFWISLALTIPTLVWGHMLQNTFGYHAPTFRGSMYIPAILVRRCSCTEEPHSSRAPSES